MESYPGSSHNRGRGDPSDTCANSFFLRTPLCAKTPDMCEVADMCQGPDDYGLVHGKLCSTLHTLQGVQKARLTLVSPAFFDRVDYCIYCCRQHRIDRRNNTTTTPTQSRGNSAFILFLVVSRMNPLKHGRYCR